MSKSQPQGWSFLNKQGDFTLNEPQKNSYLYFPLVNEAGMMSSVTPVLGGDIKSGQNEFLMQPVSAEDLHESRVTRNFWVYVEGAGPWSAVGQSSAQATQLFNETEQERTTLEAGLLWHKIIHQSSAIGLRAVSTNFVPATADKVELMKVELTNIGTKVLTLIPTAAIPMYGRSADNIRDHRHVTSLLHRVQTLENGVIVQPSLSFDERGHRINHTTYAVLGVEGEGTAPIGFFPEIDGFVGEGGNLDWPEAVVRNAEPTALAGSKLEGFEAIGAVRFATVVLEPGQSISYVLVMAIGDDETDTSRLVEQYARVSRFDELLEENKQYWQEKLDCVEFESGDTDFDRWMKWVTLQPILRRLFGNSYLPHHDYGRGGRGWRDLWQDCLALLVMEPNDVRSMLLNNYAGVRIDGSNATIIGSKPGEFIADRNNIPRVWMDHGAWPLLTTLLYINQSGDLDFLFQEQTYFRDSFISRCKEKDLSWTPAQGGQLRTVDGDVYLGTILEHILLQNLTAFFHVGEHNNLRLEGADWNDGMDMAAEKGESVAFTAFYASNLGEISQLLIELQKRTGRTEVELSEEMLTLLDTLSTPVDYASITDKHKTLEHYYQAAGRVVTGKKATVAIDQLAKDLSRKANWLTDHVRKQEWISSEEGYEWFNGYYNNDGARVEGDHPEGVRMTLPGQVFGIMGGVATDEQVVKISAAVDRYLLDPQIGYRLNSRFEGIQQNMGRAFGFAFGHKENGAMFSHMTVMYGNALYKRGLVKEGRAVLDSVYQLSSDFDKSRMYPGVPEYINAKGRGMYQYLTGSASWLLLSVLTEVYGVKGRLGDLVLAPKLVKEQFDEQGIAAVTTLFADHKLRIIYANPEKIEYGSYQIKGVTIDGESEAFSSEDGAAIIERAVLRHLAEGEVHTITVSLG
ncbi:MAG: cellobiose phosphorylase [Gorillibacterium sp.]|nr:cellobiose phosphorylase [Gorillibacterium sp.]